MSYSFIISHFPRFTYHIHTYINYSQISISSLDLSFEQQTHESKWISNKHQQFNAPGADLLIFLTHLLFPQSAIFL